MTSLKLGAPYPYIYIYIYVYEYMIHIYIWVYTYTHYNRNEYIHIMKCGRLSKAYSARLWGSVAIELHQSTSLHLLRSAASSIEGCTAFDLAGPWARREHVAGYYSLPID